MNQPRNKIRPDDLNAKLLSWLTLTQTAVTWKTLGCLSCLGIFIVNSSWLSAAPPVSSSNSPSLQKISEQASERKKVSETGILAELHQESPPASPAPATTPADPEVLITAPVGMSARLGEVVLPGELLSVKPLSDRHEPLVLRIVESYPHGTAHRYLLEFYALEPGTYNLSEWLRPAGTAERPELPPLWVEAKASLAEGQITPLALQQDSPPRVGGYRLLLSILTGIWLFGLLLLLFWRKRSDQFSDSDSEPEISLADRLRPLVQQARAGQLPTEKRAELERTLIAHWCRQLELKEESPYQVMKTLRQHPEAGALLRSLEDWLHRPEPAPDVDLEKLLAPYENITYLEGQETGPEKLLNREEFSSPLQTAGSFEGGKSQ